MSTPQHPEPGANVPQQPGYVPAGSPASETAQPTVPLPPFPGQPQQAPAQQPFAQQAPQPQRQPAPAYAQPAYSAGQTPASVPQGTTLDKTNTFAFLSIILAFIAPVAGIVFGHMGLSQIKRTGDSGRGIALTGLIISYAWFAFIAVFMVLYVGFIMLMIGSIADSASSFGYNY
ncbi:uncharacterized protein DUF4190 [Leucobacter luti]|uniref:DUF4190 domain-containing protein n=1 Tax=Leucobacter luti TaxID=340320 RepID=UPI00104C7FB0|nr:DUF4190 domain-containing protein [Leucobacter luti]MCW2288558.1 hypothetical protein [Leucobacter luti]TCK45286.1 uncharacterized protein DUF4190 [Leucobacter luti]